MKFIKYTSIDRLIIDTVRHYSVTTRFSLSLLIIYIRIRSAKESHIKLSYIHLKFDITRFGKPQLIIELHFLK